MKKALLFSTLIILALLITGIAILSAAWKFPRYSPAAPVESAKPLNSPYIGWYRMFEYILSDTVAFDASPIKAQEYGPELILLEINLVNYRENPISITGLNQLNEILSTWHSMGRQLIVRFTTGTEMPWNRSQKTSP